MVLDASGTVGGTGSRSRCLCHNSDGSAGRRVALATINLFLGVARHFLSAGCCGLGRLAVHGAAAEDIVVAGDILIAEVEEEGGVEGHTAKAGLKMQVGTCASSSVSAKTDGVAGADGLVLSDQML